jgi:MoxR-like ATPase
MRTDADQNLRQDVSFIKDLAYSIKSNVEQVIVGKGDIIDLTLTALIAQGHVLWMMCPAQQTKLARSVSRSTMPLFPGTVYGGSSPVRSYRYSFLQPEGRRVCIRPGPLFSNILHADENQQGYGPNAVEPSGMHGGTSGYRGR